MARHEDAEPGLHPVAAEALGGLVADDVRNALGHALAFHRRGQIRRIGHGGGCWPSHCAMARENVAPEGGMDEKVIP